MTSLLVRVTLPGEYPELISLDLLAFEDVVMSDLSAFFVYTILLEKKIKFFRNVPEFCCLTEYMTLHNRENNGINLNYFYLQVHNRIHTGAKPFKCTYCGMNFARSFQLTVSG